MTRASSPLRQIVCASFALWLGGVPVAQAQAEPGVVVELFTSQGCSSCPPADEYMAALVADPGVIALSLHVDYWDYIGWADDFARPQFTERQKAYARQEGSRTIYTPQMIVGGLDRVEGSQPELVAALLRQQQQQPSPVRLTVDRHGDRVSIRAEAEPALAGPARVQLVRYTPSQTVTIAQGENAGRTMTYHNIVTDWQVLGDWSGQEALEIEADAKGPQPVVVIIQSAGPGGILAAARLK